MGSEGPQEVTFHVTGFKKFHGVADNPTETIVTKLEDYLKKNPSPKGVKLGSCTILETAGQGAVAPLYRTLNSLVNNNTQQSECSKVILLHFGVNSGATRFAIECQAVNEATFRCPDEMGWKPHKVPIIPADGGISKVRKVRDVEVNVLHQDQTDSEFFIENPKPLEPNGLSDLLDFQTRLSALEKVIVEDITTVATIKPKPTKPDTEELKPTEEQKRTKAEKLRARRYLTLDNLNITKPKPEISELRKPGIPIRDIPLDQASDGSSSANSRSRSRRGYLRSGDMMIEQMQIAHHAYETETNPRKLKLPYEPQIEDLGVDKLEVISNQESQKGKILNRLKSDAQKLADLNTTVKDLTTRIENVKRSKKPIGVDFETVKEQLEEAEETILQLVNVNAESTASIEKNPSLIAWVEQDDTWKSSEKIKRMQLEVQKIQYVFLELDGNKGKGKGRFSRTKSVILRDFMRRGKSSGGRSRRKRLCGCFTPSPTKGDRVVKK